MPKGSSSRFRSGGNSRTGLRDFPAELRETLVAYAKNPALLDGLPPTERAKREQQLAAYQARRQARSAATKRGHETRASRRKRAAMFVSVWQLAEQHAAAALEEAAADAHDLAAGSTGWTADDYFEELVDAQAEEVALVLREAAVATGRVSVEFGQQTTARRLALEHRYDPEPASADGSAPK